MSQVCPWGTPDLRERKVPALQRQTIWPVGQVVKTAASHAVNIGSNPVRVTIFLLTRELEKFIIQLVFRLLPDNIEVRPFLRGKPAKRLPRRARSDGESELSAEPGASDTKSATSKLVPIRARVHPFPFRTR